MGRRKIKAILLLTGMPVIAMTLLIWFCLDDGETAPQVATAIEQSPPNQPGAMHATRDTTKDEPATPGEYATRQPAISPTSTTAKEMRQHPKSGQTISTAATARSTFLEAFKFLARMKPEPETTAPVSAQAAPPPKPDKPRDANPEPVVSRAAAIAPAPSQLGIKLGGIMCGSDGKIAIINNRPVRVGQTVNKAKVVHIGDFSVEIELKGRRYLVGIASSQHVNAPEKAYSKNESSGSDDDEAESKTEDEEKEK